MATQQLNTRKCFKSKDNPAVGNKAAKIKMLLVVALIFASALTVPAQTEKPKSEAEIALEKAITELGPTLNRLTALDESNKDLVRSMGILNLSIKENKRLKLKIDNEIRPALTERFVKLREKKTQLLASGCPEEETMVATELANRCNPQIDKLNAEYVDLYAARVKQIRDADLIEKTLKEAYAATLENFSQQKKNNAAIEDLRVKKLELYKEVITRSLKVVKGAAAASDACKSLPLEKASCCLSVVHDDTNPAVCDVELLFKLFEKSGVFSTTEVKPAKY